jgi:hypothetical protein
MEKARRACEAIFLDEGLPQIIVEITSSNFNIYTVLARAARQRDFHKRRRKIRGCVWFQRRCVKVPS